jgi:hypothetical protein
VQQQGVKTFSRWRMDLPSEQSLERKSPSPSSVRLAATSTQSPRIVVREHDEAAQICDHCGGRFGMVTHRWWATSSARGRAKTRTSVSLRSAEIKSVAGTASSARGTVSNFSTLQTNRVLTGTSGAPSSATSGTRTSSTRFDTPSFRPPGSGTSGRIDCQITPSRLGALGIHQHYLLPLPYPASPCELARSRPAKRPSYRPIRRKPGAISRPFPAKRGASPCRLSKSARSRGVSDGGLVT